MIEQTNRLLFKEDKKQTRRETSPRTRAGTSKKLEVIMKQTAFWSKERSDKKGDKKGDKPPNQSRNQSRNQQEA